MTIPRSSHSDCWLPGKLLAVFLIIVGAKLALMSLCSSPLPFFDQWQGEGRNLLLPWMEGRLNLADLFAAHNDHRILWTRLLVLGLFALNQQWDAQVEMIVAAWLHAGCAVILGGVLIRRLEAKWETPVLVTLLLIFGLPFDWEDTLAGGFQSQFYFLILFALVTIWGMASHAPFSGYWWGGVVAAVGAWFSIASGPLVTMSVAGWMIVRLFIRAGQVRANWMTLAASMALTIAGMSLRPSNRMPGNLEPKSLGDFVSVFAGLLSWPLQWPVGALLMYLPLVGLLWKLAKDRRTDRSLAAEDFLIPMGFWVVIQAAALAYARNRYGNPLEISRYMVFLAPGVLVNLGCAAVLARYYVNDVFPPVRRRLLLGGTVAVAGLVLLNLARLTREDLHEHLPMMRTNNARQRENIAAFLTSGGNPKTFEGKSVYDVGAEFIPDLMDLLRHPVIRRILPSSIQTPLPIAPDRNRQFDLVVRKPSTPGEIVEPAWATDGAALAQPAAFRSKEISTEFPYVEFATSGRVAVNGSVIALAGQSEKVIVPQGIREPGTAWSRVLVKVPSSPFHLEAVCRGGEDGGFAFTFPRPVGLLSAWARLLLEKDAEVMAAGLILWLAIAMGQRIGRPDDAAEQG